MLDRRLVGIVDVDHLGVALNGVLGALRIRSQGSTQYITYNLIIRLLIYLAGYDDDLLDDSSSLVLEELLNDVVTDSTCPSNGEVHVSRHELTLSAVRDFGFTDALPLRGPALSISAISHAYEVAAQANSDNIRG